MDPTKRAAIYVRISADREGRELGVERQEKDCRALAKRLKVTVVHVYSDNDISASRRSTKPRPGYDEMLSDVRAGRIGVVLAATSNRLTRRPREFEDLIDLVEDRGLDIHTVLAGQIDLSTSQGRAFARILAAMDAQEADQISERVRREREQRREQGRWHGGFRPFGFEPDGRTPRPAEQELIRAGCEHILEGGSLRSLCKFWDEEGHPTPTWRVPFAVKPWNTHTVRDILRNPRIAGMLPDQRPSRDWEPIVDVATWQGVRAILEDPGRKTGDRGDTRLLTGIGLCGLCGATLNGGVSRDSNPTYRCSAVKHLDRRAEAVDDYVARVVIAYLAKRKVRMAPTKDTPGRGDLAKTANGLRARLRQTERDYDEDLIDARRYQTKTAKIQAELEQLEAQLAEQAGNGALIGLPMDKAGLTAWWEAQDDPEHQRRILRALPMTITVHSPGRGRRAFDPDTVQIEWTS